MDLLHEGLSNRLFILCAPDLRVFALAEKRGERLLVGVVGMPGSGKSIVSDVARELGFHVIVMGDAVRAEARRRGLEPTGEAMRKLMLELRAKKGPAVVAELCFPLINSAGELVLIEGIRSLHEVEAFKKRYGSLFLIAVHSSPKTRFERLITRGRPDDPSDWEEFCERDRTELSVGIGSAIALADYVLVNEGPIEELKEKTRDLLRRLVEEWRARA